MKLQNVLVLMMATSAMIVSVGSYAGEGVKVLNTGSELIAKFKINSQEDLVLRLPSRSGAEEENAERAIRLVGKMMHDGEVARLLSGQKGSLKAIQDLVLRPCRKDLTECGPNVLTVEQMKIVIRRAMDSKY